ncbi:Snaclec A6 [Holothuria leucospilota]|uniref:Snaclec A6 n=1 Tax=Holothuria leucospilota TaxID=206669 RepID=A0A9Q0YBH1_HOLLE|nr:Snaclec A6 [Holothuria leucospilota]
MNWDDAQEACSSYNNDAHLVFIESDAENEFVIDLIDRELNATGLSSDVWLGITYDHQTDHSHTQVYIDNLDTKDHQQLLFNLK